MINIYHIPGFTHPLSSIIHFTGAIFFAYQAYFLIKRGHGDSICTLSLAVFSGSCVLLLLISGIYHLLSASGTAHSVFQRLDHAAIFLVIAGTFTPIHCILFSGFFKMGISRYRLVFSYQRSCGQDNLFYNNTGMARFDFLSGPWMDGNLYGI
jgi:hemolysin III